MSQDVLANSNIDNTIQEIHNLAYFYHWGYAECWHIPSRERGVFNDRIKKQIKAENNGGSSGSSPTNSYKENTDRF